MKNLIKRRDFIKTISASALLASSSQLLNSLNSIVKADDVTTITILHTNDTHSQIEPFETGTRNAGLGGIARRATFIKRVKKENPNTLMCDGGDMFQGTPYFNFYHGEVEVKALSAAGYDVVTLGNHDFDEGVESLARMLKFATFEVVSANYDVSQSPLKEFVKPYIVRQLSNLKVGLFGMGVDFNGLVVDNKHQGVSWKNPVECVRPIVEKLRKEDKVDLVIGLSHLGYRYDNEPERYSDLRVAKEVPGIDFIVGGHTHTFMKEPFIVKHDNGKQTILFQVGYAGINVGRVDFKFVNRQLTSWKGSVHNVEGALISEVYQGDIPTNC